MIERYRITPQALAERQRKPKRKELLTDLGIKRLRPPKEQLMIWDTVQKGLALLVSPGETKAFRSTYKLNGKWMSRTLGRFGEVVINDGKTENANVKWARLQTEKDRANARQGIDPKVADKPKVEAAKLTYEAVVDQFVELYAKPNQRTWKETQRTLKVTCRPWLDRPFLEITKKDAYTLLEGFIRDGHGPKADVALAWIKKLWRWAAERDIITFPIMDTVKIKFKRRVRDRWWSDDEVRAIWRAAETLTVAESAYVKCLVLLAPRKTALAEMTWADLDDPANPSKWTTPAHLVKQVEEKTRTYTTPLPPLAVCILRGLRRERLGRPVDLVFKVRVKNDNTLKRHLIAAGAPADFTWHQVRHTVATWLQSKGWTEWERGLVLNHAESSVTGGYSHSVAIDPKREALSAWADHVEGLVKPAEGGHAVALNFPSPRLSRAERR